MHIQLTDVLTCPRCGPRFGLILLADRVTDRRVQQGLLGCSNCREKYPVRNGAAALGTDPVLPRQAADEAGLLQLAALLGVTSGPGLLLVAGPGTRYAHALGALLERVEVVACVTSAESPDTPQPPIPGVSIIGVARALPFASGKLLGVALTGPDTIDLLPEAIRVLAPGARLVLTPAPPDAHTHILAANLNILLNSPDAIVASRS